MSVAALAVLAAGSAADGQVPVDSDTLARSVPRQFPRAKVYPSVTRDPAMVRIDIANTDALDARGTIRLPKRLTDVVPPGLPAPLAEQAPLSEFNGEVVGPPVARVAAPRHGLRLVGLAVATGAAGGAGRDRLVVTPIGNRVRVLNRSGALLVDLDENLDVGGWRVVAVPALRERAPSFCRMGDGHPVWGLHWCIDRAFGLGSDGAIWWARAVDPGDIVVRRQGANGELDRERLALVLGDVAFNRLATHAIALGLLQPLTGMWLGDRAGPNVLLISSGNRTVGEIVDRNGDGRADLILVAMRTR